jgi:maltoporin
VECPEGKAEAFERVRRPVTLLTPIAALHPRDSVPETQRVFSPQASFTSTQRRRHKMTSHCRRILPSAAAAAAIACSGAAQAASVDLTGYVRTGIGTNNKGGDQVCFGLPGAGAKWRLGNECENYGELNFATDVFKGSDGSRFRYNIMLGEKSTGSSGFEPLGDSNINSDRHIALRQNWIGITGVGDGIMKDATVWIGKRYYQRHDVHAMDFFYWNNSGDGVGIENINAGIGKFHVALRRDNADVTTASDPGGDLTVNNRGHSGNSLDARLSNIAVNPGGELEVGLDLRQGDEQDSTATKVKNGYILNVEHTVASGRSPSPPRARRRAVWWSNW